MDVFLEKNAKNINHTWNYSNNNFKEQPLMLLIMNLTLETAYTI